MGKNKKIASPLSQTFNEILKELHQLVFHGIPGESDPFTLSLLEREYIAFVLGIYYQCGICQKFHHGQIKKLRKTSEQKPWNWEEDLTNAAIFLRIQKSHVSLREWEQWITGWGNFSKRMSNHNKSLACYIAYGIGIARADEDLLDLAFDNIRKRIHDKEEIMGIIKDIDQVVIFMKAAASKNRTDAIIIEKHLLTL